MPPLLDINNAGQYNSVGAAQGRLNDTVSQIAPFAPSFHIQADPGPVNYVAPFTPDNRSNIAKAAGFVATLGSEIGHMAINAGDWLARNTAGMVYHSFHTGADISHLGFATYNLYQENNERNAWSNRLDTLQKQFKAGQINHSQYVMGLKDLNGDMRNLQNEVSNNQARLNQIGHDGVTDLIDTAATITTIMTGGIGGFAAKDVGLATAAKWLGSDEAGAQLVRASANLSKLATDSEQFAKLSPVFQNTIDRVMAETVANSAIHLNAEQMARSAIVNLAIKYPIYYNYLSSTGADIYNKLDNKQYGSALQQIAFNAALMLSGGPIGYALKYGGKAAGAVVSGTFSRTPFVDELSRLMFNNPATIYNTIKSIDDPALQKDVIQKFSHMEATNLGAVGENEYVAAANRVVNGMESTYAPLKMSGLDPNNAHDEIMAIYNHFKAQELFNAESKRLGISNITAGRWDARSISQVTSDIMQADSVEGRLQMFDNMIKENPDQPWANNPYLVKQIKGLIQDNPGDNLKTAMSSIKAGTTMEGFSKSVLEQGAKLGYTPINVPNLEAPFKEGSGKLFSRYASADDVLFVRASQPLPILSHLGDALTYTGLSPYASTQRVYQIFNANLTDNIKNLDITQTIAKGMTETSKTAPKAAEDVWAKTGLSAEDIAYAKKFNYSPEDAMLKFGGGGQIAQTAASPEELLSKAPVPNMDKATDYIIKKLSNAAKSAKIKATDLRQLRTKEIMNALNVSKSDAREIQDAISQAMRSVPVEVRGLGDKTVDISYGAIKQYLRLQGAGRFAWNPFFKTLRLEPKTEILAEAEGGGALRSIFAGRWGEINPIRKALKDGGFLDKTGGLGDVFSGEAVDSTGSSRNLIKSLTKNQERSIAGLVDAQARRMGMDWREYMQTNPDQIKDTIQMIAEYDRNANFLNSPLIRTLNVAIFPFRFETKVATILARNLGKADMLTQVAFVNGLMRAHDFLNSPEGHAWYSRNSEAIGLFNYITPLAELNRVVQSLLPGHDHTLGNFGELGGLPFGWITQLLDAEGLTNFNQTGINPKTGDPFPKYIPATQKGQAAVAIQDFLNSLFSYPGRTAGLPSKSDITQKVALGLVNGDKKTDLKKAPAPALSPAEQQFKNDIPPAQQVQAAAASGPPPPPPVAVPSTGQLQMPIPRATPSRSRSKKQFTPALLPGQTSFGQLP